MRQFTANVVAIAKVVVAEKLFLSLLIPSILMLLEEILELNRKLTKQ